MEKSDREDTPLSGLQQVLFFEVAVILGRHLLDVPLGLALYLMSAIYISLCLTSEHRRLLQLKSIDERLGSACMWNFYFSNERHTLVSGPAHQTHKKISSAQQ